MTVEPRKFYFNDYLVYVRECCVMEDYIAALDAEDVADGVILNRDLPCSVPHANHQKEAVLSSVVVDLMARLSSIRDAMSYIDASGVLPEVGGTGVKESLADIREACDVRDDAVVGAARSVAHGYKVVPLDSPMMLELEAVKGVRDLLELMCIIYNHNYSIATPQDRAAIDPEALKWYKAIRSALR
jgi:hypothetical protein